MMGVSNYGRVRVESIILVPLSHSQPTSPLTYLAINLQSNDYSKATGSDIQTYRYLDIQT
jgi:hypothetical protein